MCAVLMWSNQVWAAELVTGMNVNIQVWSAAQRDALLEQLTTGKALAAIPLLVHLAGTYIINNFGGLGGGM
jgi:hypothetical protein